MDEQRLQQIKERVERATATPWRVRERGGFHEYDVEGPPPGVRGAFQRYEDADLIASAREDLPALVEALEEARAAEGQATRVLAAWSRESWPEEAEEVLREAAEREPSESVRGKMERTLAGERLDRD